jgi:hypothetical protein
MNPMHAFKTAIADFIEHHENYLIYEVKSKLRRWSFLNSKPRKELQTVKCEKKIA